MFQRIKGAIDSRIAEEQARTKALATPSAARSSSLNRTDSKKALPPKQKRDKRSDDSNSIQGPDPSEFEDAFVIEDDEEEVEMKVAKDDLAKDISEPDKSEKENDIKVDAEESGLDHEKAVNHTTFEVPPDIRIKLRKLERLETKYQELLRSYRVAYSRAISIDPFEKQLRENTPLSSISDPDAFGEYLNQITLKGGMLMDELKRVSADRDQYKKMLEESQTKTSELQEELAKIQRSGDLAKSKAPVTLNSSLATTRTTTDVLEESAAATLAEAESPEPKLEDENLFSVGDEIPKLQIEVKEKNVEIENLRSKVLELNERICTAQESNSSLTASLEKARQDLKNVNEAMSQDNLRLEKKEVQAKEIETLEHKLAISKEKLSSYELMLENLKVEYEAKLSNSEKRFVEHVESSGQALNSASNASKEVQGRCEALATRIEELEQTRKTRMVDSSSQYEDLAATQSEKNEVGDPPLVADQLSASTAMEAGKKKKNKKKKKFTKLPESVSKVNGASLGVTGNAALNDFELEVSELQEKITKKDIQICNLQSKRKTEEDLREEIENMRESLLNIGQEHVEAKEKIKGFLEERKKIQEIITPIVDGFEDYKIVSTDASNNLINLKILVEKYEKLKSESAAIQSDLGASQQLATSRYKDLVEIRGALQKAQSELARFRTENSNLKGFKEELTIRTSELKRLESKEKDLRAEIANYKKQAADSQSEIRALRESCNQEKNARLRAEDHQRIAQRDMRKSEAEKIQIAAAGEKSVSKLLKCEEESSTLRLRIRDLEDQVSKLGTESKNLRDEVELRGSQYSNTQGLLGSMRDQATEMAMQLKEAKSHSESLSEELFEVQRLLSERTREAETMRRLLADVDDRTDAKVQEMRDKMELAIEERDRANDEASTNSRRRAREVDKLKTQLRDLERDLKENINAKEELVRAESEWRSKREELELISSSLKKEVDDIRAAMNPLQDALNRSEKVVKETEKQKHDLRKLLEEINQRHERLQKDYKTLQLKMMKINEEPDRTSMERRSSEIPKTIDFVYLKTIILQFLEQKDRKVQESLVRTVLGQLLNLDKKDQERWIAAITLK